MAKILVIDDRAPERELLATLLKYARHHVLEAADATEALRLVQSEHPDLVISDVLLPGIDGYEFVRRLRADPSTAGTSVIFYTAVFNEREARALARDCGVSRILSKPTEPQKILDAVAEVLGDRGAGEISPLPENFEDKHHQLLVDKLMQQVDALRESEERFRLLAEHATDIVFRLRLQPARIWEYVNPAVTAVLGYTPQECYADPDLLFRIAHPNSRDDLEGYLSGKSAPGKAMLICWTHKDGRTVWAEIRGTPLFNGNGNPLAMEGMARDITERREAEEEIRRARNGLEIRVKERTAELAKANEELKTHAAKLEQMNEELQEFAFVASHDLKEPLRKIISFGGRLKERYDDSLGEEGKDYLERMTNAANRMNTLLAALLAYSRITSKPNPFERTDLAGIARDAASDLELAIERAGARVEIGELPVVMVDPDQMRQLFQNLIGNAIKYFEPSNDCANPNVRVYGRLEGGSCLIFVEDNGIGFHEAHLDRIFRPFQRLHGRGQYEGTGMGLAICRKIAERHGGTITARSTPGKGSTFIVTLPLRL
jgi:PAS domain S-box-containing protein